MQLTRLLPIGFLLAAMACESAGRASPANDVLSSAASPFEDLIEFALAGSDQGISTALAAADRNVDDVDRVLSGSPAKEFPILMEALHAAAAEKRHQAVAENAVQIFRVLIQSLSDKGLAVPKDVSLLDYAGFKLRVLGAADIPNWLDIRKTVAEAGRSWKAIDSSVSRNALRDAVSSVVRGLDDAAKAEDLAMLRFAAQIDLDLVDLLEADLAPHR